MKIRLWNMLRRLLRDPRLTMRYGNGAWITLNEQDYLQREILIHGEYETEVWTALASCATRAEVVWDVGANIGSVAILAATDPRVAAVHAFEPDPLNRQILLLNSRLNHGAYVTHALALSDQVDHRRIYHGPAINTGMSSLARGGENFGRSFVVECVTADKLVFTDGLPAPTLMKIDVEGWELFVLKGAQRLLSVSPPKAIVFEAECSSNLSIVDEQIPALLERLCYEVDHIPRLSGCHKDRENYIARRR